LRFAGGIVKKAWLKDRLRGNRHVAGKSDLGSLRQAPDRPTMKPV
jgi:hypothetical protein